MPKPNTVAVQVHNNGPREGGEWIPFAALGGRPVYAVKFADGSVWECVNGWSWLWPKAQTYGARYADEADHAEEAISE